MTNYNDGNWHGWNGGECPVHPKTIVEVIWFCSGRCTSSEVTEAGRRMTWVKDDPKGGVAPIAFRVIRAHREPEEVWVGRGSGGGIYYYATKAQAVANGWPADGGPDADGNTLRLFREVIE